MAIKISDEALDALDSAPEEERNAFIDSLDEEEAGQLHMAVQARQVQQTKYAQTDKLKAASAAVPGNLVMRPELAPPDPAKALEPLEDWPILTGQQKAPWYEQIPEPREGGLLEQTPQRLAYEALGVLNKWKDETIVPAVQMLQENVGKPVADTFMAASNAGSMKELGDALTGDSSDPALSYRMAGYGPLGETSTKAISERAAKIPGTVGMEPAKELLMRRFLVATAGSDYVDQMTEKEKLEAVDTLENMGTNAYGKEWGPIWAAGVQGVAENVGKAPLLLIGANQVRAMTEAKALAAMPAAFVDSYPLTAKVLSLAAGTSAEGAVIGGGTALVTKGEKVEHGVVAGAAVGAAIPLVAGAVAGGAKLAVHAAAATGATALVGGVKGVLKARSLAIFTKNAMLDFADEVERFGRPELSPEQTAARIQEGLEAPHPQTQFTYVKLNEINPTTVKLIIAPNGQLTGRIVEFSTTGAHKLHDMPITGYEAMKKLDEFAAQNDLVIGGSRAAMGSNQLTGRMAFRANLARRSGLPDPMAEVLDLGDPYKDPNPNFIGNFDPNTGRRAVTGPKTRPETPIAMGSQPQKAEVTRFRKGGGVEEAVVHNPDAPPPYLKIRSNMMVQDGNQLKMVPMGDAAPTISTPARVNESNFITDYVAAHQGVVDGPPVGKRPVDVPLPRVGEEAHVQLPTADIRGKTYASGVVVGPDPKKAGNVLVQLTSEKGKEPISYPADEVHPTTPPGVANLDTLDKVTLEPLPPPQPGQLTKPQIDGTVGVVKLIRYMQQQSQTNWQKMVEAILPAHRRGPADVAELIQYGLSAKNSRIKSQEELIKAIREKLPEAQRSFFSQASGDLEKVVRGKMRFADMAKNHPEISSQFQKLSEDLMTELQNNSKQLELMGYIPEGLTHLRETGAVEQYLASVYRAHYLPAGEWAKIAPASKLESGIDFIWDELKRDGMYITRNEVANKVQEVMRDVDPLGALKRSEVSRPWRHLLAKKEIPQPIKDLLGEETSGILKVALSLANQRTLIDQLALWEEIAGKRVTDKFGRSSNPYWSPGPRPDLHPEQVPDLPNQFGKAAGGYLRKDMYEALVSQSQAHAAGPSALRAIAGTIKMNQTVLAGPRPWLNNGMRNIKPAILSGGLDPVHPVDTFNHFRAALQLLLDWRENPTAVGSRALVLEARKLGALPAGFGRTEGAVALQGKVFRDLQRELQEMKPGQNDIWDLISKVREHGTKIGEKMDDRIFEGTEMYDLLGDQWWKFGSYLHIRAKGIQAGLAPAEAARKAAVTIAKRFPNFEHVAPLTETLRGSSPGAVAPYLSGAMEDVRTNAEMIRDLTVGGDTELRLNFLKGAALLSSMYAASKGVQSLNGITETEVDEALAVRSKSQQVFKPLLMPKPYRDEFGRVQFWDFSSWIPELQFLQGHPDDGPLKNTIVNSLLIPFQSSSLGSAVRKGIESTGFVRPMGKEFALREGEAGALAALRFAAQAGAFPNIIQRTYEEARKAGMVGTMGRNEELRTPGQFAGSMVGLPEAGGITSPAGEDLKRQAGQPSAMSPTRRGSVMEYAGTIVELRRQIQSTAASNMPYEDKQKLIQAALRRIVQLSQEQRDINAKIQKSKEAQSR